MVAVVASFAAVVGGTAEDLESVSEDNVAAVDGVVLVAELDDVVLVAELAGVALELEDVALEVGVVDAVVDVLDGLGVVALLSCRHQTSVGAESPACCVLTSPLADGTLDKCAPWKLRSSCPRIRADTRR